MNLPLIKYDFGAVFGSLVGETDQRQRRALARVQAQGRCGLLIDEADKAFGGIVGASGDSGVGQRALGKLLSWMANDNQDAFVILTVNRVENVPIETLRAGRLDAIFSTDLPHELEREVIFSIHSRRNGFDWSKFSPGAQRAAVNNSAEYSGAEIEQACIRASRMAFRARKTLQPTALELEKAITSITPVSRINAQEIKLMREFCNGRATPVSKPLSKKLSAKTSRLVGGDN
jgi:SpoVK/Ycf46/Vps4 family AAA+-type ATPase